VQRKTKQHGNQQHLQNLAFRESVEERIWNNVEDEIGSAHHLARAGISCHGFGVQTGGVYIHTCAGLQQIDQNQANDKRKAADHFKVKQCQTARLAYLFHVFHASDADHDSTENNGCDHHLYQLDEAVSQRFHFSTERGVEIAKGYAGNHRAYHLKIKRAV